MLLSKLNSIHSPTPLLYISTTGKAQKCHSIDQDTPQQATDVNIEAVTEVEQTPPSASEPHATSTKERKSLSRAKKQIQLLGPVAVNKLLSFLTGKCIRPTKKSPALSPSPNKVKHDIKKALTDLSKKRSKGAIAKKNLLSKFVSPERPDSNIKKDLYKRSKVNSATAAALDYMNNAAIDLPGKRSVCRKTQTQKKILPKRLKHHKLSFEKETGQKVSLRTMYRHKPRHILTSHRQSYKQCLCEVCTNIDLKIDALNKILKGTLLGQIQGRDALSEMTLCNDVTIDCINRTCKSCGVELVRDRLVEAIAPQRNSVLEFASWEMVQREKGKRRELVKAEHTAHQLLLLLLEDLESFSKHVFTFRWQFSMFKQLRYSLPSTWALGVFDFAENFLCKYQDEVQSAHWGYNQVTVHPSVLYYACTHTDCSEMVTDTIIYLSDDINHDAHFAKSVTDRCKKHLQKTFQNKPLEKFVIFSDGCSSQYKSKLPFFHLCEDLSVPIERCYFGSRHGKSACDAAGGVIKRLTDDDILSRRAVIQSAEAMYDNCMANYKIEGPCVHTRRSFQLIRPEEIDRKVKSSQVSTLVGTRQLHSLCNIGKNKLATRKLSCFCINCLSGQFENCTNIAFVDQWKEVTLTHSVEEQVTDNTANLTDADDEISEPSMPREIFFKNLGKSISSISSFDDLKIAVSDPDTNFSISQYEMPIVMPRTVPQVNGTVDKGALSLLPSCAPPAFFPVQTGADGNCLSRSLSKLVFGHEKYHLEIRCRLNFELTSNIEYYSSCSSLAQNESDKRFVQDMLATITEGVWNRDSIDGALKFDIMSSLKPCSFMGLWHMAAAASLFGHPVVSIFPEKGWQEFQSLTNRTLQPREGTYISSEPLHILWTSTRADEMEDEHFTANHFVPLLPLSLTAYDYVPSSSDQCIKPVLHCFFEVCWQGQTYVARIEEIAEDGFLHLKFMKECDGFYFWPVTEDYSWEHPSVLSAPVELDLVPERSTQRKQMYKVF